MKAKAKKPKDTPDAELARFKEMAKQLGADERPEEFDKAFKKIADKVIATRKSSARNGS